MAGFKGLDIRQTSDRIIFRAALIDDGGSLLASGDALLYLYELQSDGTLKSYDWNDNTFKTTALTTATASLAHRKGDNDSTNTGYWTYMLSTLTAFTAGNIYIAMVHHDSAGPQDQHREFQFGSAQGDLTVTDGRLETDATAISGSSTAADVLAAKNYSAYSDGVIVVADSTTDTGRAANLRAAYTAAKALTPGGNALATNNRAKVLLPPGRYDFGTGDGTNHGLEVDTEFVDLFGLTGNRDDVMFTSQIATASRGTLEQTADDVRIEGITMDIAAASLAGVNATRPAAFFPGDNLPNTKIKNCKFTTQNGTNAYAMRRSIEYSGDYENSPCIGDYGYGGGGEFSGKATNCLYTGDYGFGGVGIFSGEATNLLYRGDRGFGGGTADDVMSGTCTDIVYIGNGGFGGGMGTVMSGTCVDCVLIGSFGYGGGLNSKLSGTLIRCVEIGNIYFRNCEGATIEDCYLECEENNRDCLILKDDLTIVTNSTILVLEGGTGIPINDDGNARTVCASGNRFNNLDASATGLGTLVTNKGVDPVMSQTDKLQFTSGNRVRASSTPASTGIGGEGFLFSMSSAAAENYIISEDSSSDSDETVLDATKRTTTHVNATVGTQWQLTLNVLQHDPDYDDPWVEYSSSNEAVATVNSEGFVGYVAIGTCKIIGVSQATESSPSQRFEVEITNTSSGGETTDTITYIADALDPAKHVLLVYNSDSADSTTLKNYVQSNLPGMDTANVLDLSGLPDSTSTTAANVTSLILDPLYTWLVGNEAAKPIRYIICLRGIPSRDESNPYGYSGGLSVLYQVYDLLKARGYRSGDKYYDNYKGGESRFTRAQYPSVTALVSFLDMGSYTATNAYIDKLKAASDAGGLQADDVTIDGSAGGVGGTKWCLDEKRSLTSYPDQLSDDNDQLATEGIDAGDITYQSDKSGTAITVAADVTYFANWGIYTLGSNWPTDSALTFSGDSGWWLGMGIESFNGIYGHPSHGDPMDIFAATAFGGTDYSNTPIGFVGNTGEQGLGGPNTLHYPGRWARGWNAGECSWAGRNGELFLHVGYPFVQR